MFHMLRMAAEKLEADESTAALAQECRAALADVREAAPNGSDWTKDPDALLAVRKKVAEQFEKVWKYIEADVEGAPQP